MNGCHFLLVLTILYGGLLFGYEIGLMDFTVTIVKSIPIFLFKLYSTSCSWMNFQIKSLFADTMLYTISLQNNLVEVIHNKLLIKSSMVFSKFVFGAFSGAVLASYFKKKYGRRRHSNNVIRTKLKSI